MIPRRIALTLALASAAHAPLAAYAQADKATIDALEGYFDFVDANAGTILPEQIPAEDYRKFHVLDVRRGAVRRTQKFRQPSFARHDDSLAEIIRLATSIEATTECVGEAHAGLVQHAAQAHTSTGQLDLGGAGGRADKASRRDAPAVCRRGHDLHGQRRWPSWVPTSPACVSIH